MVLQNLDNDIGKAGARRGQGTAAVTEGQRQIRAGERRQGLVRRQAGWQAGSGADGEAQSRFDRSPDAAEAGADEGQRPGPAGGVQSVEGALTEEAGGVGDDQRDRNGRVERDGVAGAYPDGGHGGDAVTGRARIGRQGEGEVELAPVEPLQQQPIPIDNGGDADVGLSAAEAAERLGQPSLGEVGGEAQPHLSGQTLTLDGRDRLVVQVQDATGVGQQPLAGFGRNQATAALAEQGLAELILQPTQLLADGRLGSPHPIGRAPEPAQPLRQDQGAQDIHVEVGRVQQFNPIND